jgi:hypothetical protein
LISAASSSGPARHEFEPEQVLYLTAADLKRYGLAAIDPAEQGARQRTEAAKGVGMNKTSILRAIKSGRISGTRDELGQWHVEPVELHRVFPPVAEQRCTTDATQ